MRKNFLSGLMILTVLVWAFGAVVVPAQAEASLKDGDLIKASGQAVYYYKGDKRYVFANQKTYNTWYQDFSGVVTISDAQLASVMIGGNVVYRPGTRLIKITTDPKVYAVEPGGLLRWVQTEAVAKSLYGDKWASKVDDVPDALFAGNYSIGDPIGESVHPVGSLVKYANSDDYYYISTGPAKRLISSGDAFTANLFNEDYALTTDIEYSDGSAITGKEASLADASQSDVEGSEQPYDDEEDDTTTATGTLKVAVASDSPANQTAIADSNHTSATVTDGAQALISAVKYAFTASDSDVKVTELKLKRSGISADTDLSNAYLYDDAGTRLAQYKSFTSAVLTFRNSAGLFTVSKGTTKNVFVKFDLANGTTSGKQIYLSILDGYVTTDGATVSYASSLISNQIATATVSDLGKLVVANVSTSTTVDAGATDFELWRFSLAGSDQNLYVDKLIFTMVGTVDETAIQNIDLYNVNTGTVVGTTLAQIPSGNELVFDLSASPMSLTKGQTVNMTLRGDIVGGSTRTYKFSFQQQDHVIVRDANYGVYLKPNKTDSFVVVPASSSTTINNGNVTISVATDSPTGNIPTGQTEVTLGKFNIKTTGEDVKIASLVLDCYYSGAADVDNGKIYVDGEQLGTTTDLDSNAADADYTDADGDDDTTYSFSNTFVLSSGSTKTLTIKADTTTGNGTALTDSTTIICAIGGFSATGQTSMATITIGNTTASSLTLVTADINVAVSSVLSDATATNPTGVPNSKDVRIGAFTITPTASEKVKVNQIILTDLDASLATDFQNLRITDKTGKDLAPIKGSLSGTAQTFNFSPSLEIEKAQPYVIYVVADILGSASDTAAQYNFFYVSSCTGTSGDTATAVSDGANDATHRAQNAYIAASGALVVSADASTPAVTQLVMGDTNQTLAVFKLKASAAEDVSVSRIEISGVMTGTSATDAFIKGSMFDFTLYDSTGKALDGTISSMDATYDVEYTLNDPLIVTKNKDVKLTLKGSLNSYPNAVSGGYAYFSIASASDLDSRGVSSNSTITETGSGNGSAMYLYRTKLTVTKNAASPSGTATAGSGEELLRFDATADKASDATINAVALSISGNAVLTSTDGDTMLYKSTDSTTALATEDGLTVTCADSGGTTALICDAAAVSTIPIGATIRVYDTSGTAFMTQAANTSETTFTVSALGADGTITFTPAGAANIAAADIVYYIPSQPGSGKLYFGAMTTLGADLASGATSATLTNTNGFAIGDTIVPEGYAAGVYITRDSGCVITAISSSTAIAMSGGCVLTPASTIDYNYDASGDAKIVGNATVATKINSGNGQDISAGETMTFLVKGDTTGAATNKTVRTDIATASFIWDDQVSLMINSNTKNLPLTGGVLLY